jgi:hypothetical protein
MTAREASEQGACNDCSGGPAELLEAKTEESKGPDSPVEYYFAQLRRHLVQLGDAVGLSLLWDLWEAVE